MEGFMIGILVGLVAGIAVMCALHISGCQSCIAHHLGEKEERHAKPIP
jgi:hypothetical protein